MSDEEKKAEEESESDDERNQPEELDAIKRANIAAERMEAANKKQEELLQKQEQLAAREILSGRSSLESAPKEKITDADYAQAALKGTLLG